MKRPEWKLKQSQVGSRSFWVSAGCGGSSDGCPREKDASEYVRSDHMSECRLLLYTLALWSLA